MKSGGRDEGGTESGALHRMFGAIAVSRRVVSAFCGVILLAALLFSSLFVVAESDHDCEGDGCPVCLLLQACVSGFQQTGMLPHEDAFVTCQFAVRDQVFRELGFRSPAITLQSLYVRIDE